MTAKVKKVGIIGLGTVGGAVLSTLIKNKSLIKKRTSLGIEVKKVCDLRPDKRKLANKFNVPFSRNPEDILRDPEIDIVVELIGGITPARDYIKSSLTKGKDIVTANKALLAQDGGNIFGLAESKGRSIGFEASVAGAIPIIKAVSESLVGCQVKSLHGILNGTTNYILSRMHKQGVNFKEALSAAQERGFAERVPRLDIEGFDSLHKLCILTYLAFGIWPDVNGIYVEGINKITPMDIACAKELSYRIKLLAVACVEKRVLNLRVHPTLIREDHPLSEVGSAFNAIWLDAHPCGPLLFHGQGAGGLPTSSAIVADIINVSLKGGPYYRPRPGKLILGGMDNLRTRYYVRFTALDKPGVLSKISSILARHKISIASVTQKERNKGACVPIIMLTHETREADLKKSLSGIDRLPVIKEPSMLIRIEDL